MAKKGLQHVRRTGYRQVCHLVQQEEGLFNQQPEAAEDPVLSASRGRT